MNSRTSRFMLVAAFFFFPFLSFSFVWKLASCINHLPSPQGVLHPPSSRSSILVSFPSLFSISTVPLFRLPCPRTTFSPSLLPLSLVISHLFARVYPDLHRCCFLRLLLSPREKFALDRV